MRCRSCTPIPEEVRRAADLLERRWTVSIIWASHEGAVRFNEFSQSLGSIPPGTLGARLSELEEAGLLERRVIDARPPLVEYEAPVVEGFRAKFGADPRKIDERDPRLLSYRATFITEFMREVRAAMGTREVTAIVMSSVA